MKIQWNVIITDWINIIYLFIFFINAINCLVVLPIPVPEHLILTLFPDIVSILKYSIVFRFGQVGVYIIFFQYKIMMTENNIYY